jgi:precorrin-6B methylase 2
MPRSESNAVKEANVLREKQRSSFKYKDEPWRFDLSLTKQKNEQEHQLYEIEVELLTPLNPSAVQNFNKAMTLMFQLVFESPLVYRSFVRMDVFKEVNEKLGGKFDNKPFLDLEAITQARNLNYNDLTYGGLVGGSEPYFATVKADGYRRFLLVRKKELWIIGPPNVLALLSRGQTFDIPKRWDGALFEAEEIPVSNRNGTIENSVARYFLLYDCLYAQGVSLLKQPLSERFGLVGQIELKAGVVPIAGAVNTLVQDFVNDISENPIVNLNAKMYYPLENVEVFYSSMRQMLRTLNDLPYKNDGFIFTPGGVYLPAGQLARRKGENSQGLPDILKWKPDILNTFDLLYKNGVFNSLSSEKKIEPFLPNEISTDKIVKFDPTSKNAEPAGPFFEDLVYEIGWNRRKNVYELHRVRYNKTTPNSTAVARDSLKTAQNAISVETLLGGDLILMRRYHNFEKSLLLNKGKGILLDLGSGAGGDLAKWRTYSHIYAVEPSSENLQKFKERLSKSPIKNKVTLLQGYAQDTAFLQKNVPKADTISMMMSATFLFESSQTLQQLLETIDKMLHVGGDFLLTVMDGRLLKSAEAMYPKASDGSFLFPAGPSGQPIVYLKVDGKKVTINLEGTIVKNQTEYVTDIPLLTKLLELIGFSLKEEFILDGQPFLNYSESALSRLYVGLRYHRNSFGDFNSLISTLSNPSASASLTSSSTTSASASTPSKDYRDVKIIICGTPSKKSYSFISDFTAEGRNALLEVALKQIGVSEDIEYHRRNLYNEIEVEGNILPEDVTLVSQYVDRNVYLLQPLGNDFEIYLPSDRVTVLDIYQRDKESLLILMSDPLHASNLKVEGDSKLFFSGLKSLVLKCLKRS